MTPKTPLTAAEKSRLGKLRKRENHLLERAARGMRPAPWPIMLDVRAPRTQMPPGFDHLDVLKGFVFVDEQSRENALWAFLWAMQARYAVPSTVFRPPLVLIVGGPGTGKSEMIRRMGGEEASGLPTSRQMLGQWLNAIAAEQDDLLILDLVDARFMKAPELASFVTASEWKYRLLGKNDTATSPLHCLTVATAPHEVKLSDEMKRRCVVIKLGRRDGQ